MQPTRVFIHGLESSSQGTKGVFFRARYPDMIIEDFFGLFPQRMEKLEGLLAGKKDLILVGSRLPCMPASTKSGHKSLFFLRLPCTWIRASPI
jgi:hypothetical protein